MKKIIRLCSLLLCACLWAGIRENVYAQKPLVIVLDPGHGGENLGADYNGFVEKEMNLVVANAMYEELSKYEGITVYMTRTEDVDMSLQERVDYAKSVNADFFFCLHFNMSEYHTLFGTEVWVPAFGDLYAAGYTFADIQIQEMTALGLYNRGIKTRLNSKGTDYYGILRHCTEYHIPSALIEHGHIDHKNDVGFCDSPEDWKQLGIADATAVARYFGLASTILGVDYGQGEIPYEHPIVAASEEVIKPDSTPPDISVIEEKACDYENGSLTVGIRAQDAQSGILYLSYSIDGGETFGELLPWEGTVQNTETDTANHPVEYMEFTVSVTAGTKPVMVVNIYNGYDLYTTSNSLVYEQFPVPEEETKGEILQDSTKEAVTVMAEQPKSSYTDREKFLQVFEGCLLAVILAGLLVLTIILLQRQKRKKNHRVSKQKTIREQ